MSYQAIYIELQGKTSHVPPRYTRYELPQDLAVRPAMRPRASQPYGAVFRILHTPYGIRNSETGIRDLGFGISRLAPVNIGRNRVHRILHGAVFSLLTAMDMVR